jgi:hypothetical protein
MRRANLDFPWRKVGFGTNHRKINDLVLTVDQEVGGSNPPSRTKHLAPPVQNLVQNPVFTVCSSWPAGAPPVAWLRAGMSRPTARCSACASCLGQRAGRAKRCPPARHQPDALRSHRHAERAYSTQLAAHRLCQRHLGTGPDSNDDEPAYRYRP